MPAGGHPCLLIFRARMNLIGNFTNKSSITQAIRNTRKNANQGLSDANS